MDDRDRLISDIAKQATELITRRVIQALQRMSAERLVAFQHVRLRPSFAISG